MRRRLAWCVALLLGSACAARGSDKAIDGVDKATFRFGPMALGQAKDVDYTRAEGLGLVPTSPLDTYLNGVLAKLLAQSPVKGVPAHVYVRASGDWAAKSTADANIYVALGTLLRLDNEDEVAALLAHEASHIILGHANTDAAQSVQQRALQLSALAAQAQQVVDANQGKTGGGAKAVSGKVHVNDQSRALLLNTMLVSPAWTRGQEREADKLGTDLLVRAGYAPQAMSSLLRKQQSFETERAANPQAVALDQQFLGYDATQKVSEQTSKAAAKKMGGAADGLGALAGSALGSALEWGSKKVDEASHSHPKTEERITEIDTYVAEEYSGTAPALQAASWESAKDQDGTADVLENYIAAIGAKGKLSDGDVAAARKLAKNGLSAPTHAHAYPNYVDAAVQIAGGDSAAALTDYQTALAGPEPAGGIYIEASALYVQTGKNDKAVEVIESGYTRLQQPPSLTVPLIRTYRAAGRQSDADRLATQCAARWPNLQQTCSDAAQGGDAAPS